MKRVLMVATVPSMLGQFNMENLYLLEELGYQPHVACNFNDNTIWSKDKVEKFVSDMNNRHIPCHQIDFLRSPWSIYKNIHSYFQMKQLFEEEKFDFIHCHTPIAAVISRIVAHKKNVKVIYTAHGFHFYKGASLRNWMVFFPVEKLLSQWTDILITINKEDYMRAKRNFHAKKTVYVPGVGVNVQKFENKNYDKSAKRKTFTDALCIPNDAFLLFSVGELNKNKNHSTVIHALKKLDHNVHYLIAGIGELESELIHLASEIGVETRVHLLGYRNDIADILKLVDVFLLPSIREGLNVSLMEAMASGLPCICGDIRGNNDLIVEGKGGYRVKSTNVDAWREAINKIIKDNLINFGLYNRNVIQNFSIDIVQKRMKEVYLEI